MKRYSFCICVLWFSLMAYSQSIIDTVSYRFVYDVQAKTYEINDRLFPDEHWLDVGKNGVSKYYSMWKERYWEVNDSIKQIGGNYMDTQRVVHEQGIESSQFYYYVYKNDYYGNTIKETFYNWGALVSYTDYTKMFLLFTDLRASRSESSSERP